ncbi:MAG: alpha-amylase family glycosyl hydrolase [bacterium]
MDGLWSFALDTADVGIREQWFSQVLDRTSWQKIEVPAYWDRFNLASYDGVAWYARTIDIEDISKDQVLFFGGVDDDADVWINGKKIGSHAGYSESFYFDLLPGSLAAGKNTVVVRVNDYAGAGGIYKPVMIVPRTELPTLLKSKFADSPARPSEDWVRDGIIYEVYLRSFSPEGTFKALERKLSEIKALGATVIWLMPIHPVGEINRKGSLGSPYSIEDYYGINPEFGTLDDFRALVSAVHSQGMKIIIDLVANHTSWDSKLILENSEWFTTNAEGAIVAPNTDWTDVADLNYDYHELRKYMIRMMEYWVREIGIDGYRCDVAEMVPTDFWNIARKQLDKIKPVMMLSEGSYPEHHLDAFDLTYTFGLYDVFPKVIYGSTMVNVFDQILQNESNQFPKGSLRLRFNTNHDKNAWDAPAVKKFTAEGAKATAVFIFTYPGVPLIYNGEEVGNAKKLDLFEKIPIDWNKNPEFRTLYQKLGALRSQHCALRRGEYHSILNSDNEKVYSFLRKADQDQILTVINLSPYQKTAVLALPDSFGNTLVDYFTGTSAQVLDRKLTLVLKPFEYRVYLPAQTMVKQ